jgi:hypothetical protein
MESDISFLLAENDSRHSDRTFWTLQVNRGYLSNNTLIAYDLITKSKQDRTPEFTRFKQRLIIHRYQEERLHH